MADDGWGTSLVNGELVIHVVEGRNLAVAAGKTASGKGSFGGEVDARLALRVRRKGEHCCVTEWKRISGRGRTAYDAKMVFGAPPAFDLVKGRLEFELINQEEQLLAKAHVALASVVHVSPGQTHTVDLLIVPADPSLPPEKLPREVSPGVKIVIYPDFPSANPSPTRSSVGGNGSVPSLSPRRSGLHKTASPVRSSANFTRFKIDESKPVRTVDVVVLEASGVKDAAESQVELRYLKSTKKTTPWSGRNPGWNEALTFTVPPGASDTTDFDNSYLHVKLLSDGDDIGSVNVELGHVLRRGGLDMWMACDKNKKSKVVGRESGSVQTGVGKESSAWVRVRVNFGRADVEFIEGEEEEEVEEVEKVKVPRFRRIPPPPSLAQAAPTTTIIRHLPAATSPASSIWRRDRPPPKIIPSPTVPQPQPLPVVDVALPVAPPTTLRVVSSTPRMIPCQSRTVSPPRPMWGVPQPSTVIRSWLEGVGITGKDQKELLEVLTRNHVTTLGSLLTLTEPELVSYGVPLGHRKRLLAVLM